MRLGSYYRKQCFQKIFGRPSGKTILDVGGYDGYFIFDLSYHKKVVLDINILKKYRGIEYRSGSYQALTHQKTISECIFLLDVLEVVENPKELCALLSENLERKGKLFISIPHPKMIMFPKFLSSWLHKKWGNPARIGYSANEIKKLLPHDLRIIKTIYVKEKYFRLLYFFIRFIWQINQRFGEKVVKWILRVESKSFYGPNGHIYLEITKK